MSFESPRFSEPIRAEHPEIHEELLNDRILEISLQFLRKRREKNEKESDCSLSKDIEAFTPIDGVIFRPLMNCGRPMSMDAELIQVCRLELNERIESLDPVEYQDHEIIEIAKDIREKVLKYIQMTRGDRAGENDEEKKQELIEMEPLRRVADLSSDSKYEALLSHGFIPGDAVLEIHIKPAFRAEHGKLQFGDIECEFQRIANRVVDRDRSAKAIIGRSWLMDTPVAKRLGFIQIPEAELPLNDFSTWFQFIDETGQIHEERLQKMLETGELPYRSMLGYVPVEDFLRRYLSEERKAQAPVVLDELVPEKYEEIGQMKELNIQAHHDWDEEVVRTGKVDFERYVERHPIVSEVFSLYSDEDRPLIVSFMREMAEKGILQKDMAAHSTGPVRRANAMFNQKIYRKTHRPKELDLSKSKK